VKELSLARELHAQLDKEYATRLFRAITRGQTRAIARNTELRRINDGAYFLIIFGTFERYVTDRADSVVKTRTSKAIYRHRRAWETLLDGAKLKTTFLNRVRVLIDQQSLTFAKVKDYYEVRNDLAHRGVTSNVFSIPNVIADLELVIRSAKS
jgi:hypothetical protein